MDVRLQKSKNPETGGAVSKPYLVTRRAGHESMKAKIAMAKRKEDIPYVGMHIALSRD